MISNEFYKANLSYQIRHPDVDYYYDKLRISDLERIIDEPERRDEIISLAILRPYIMHWAFKPGGPGYLRISRESWMK
jgi:hypothetical protein